MSRPRGPVDRRLLALTRGHRGRLAVLTVLETALALSGVLQALLLVDLVVTVWREEPPTRAVAALLGLVLVRAALVRFAPVRAADVAGRLREDLRGRVLRHALALGPDTVAADRTGVLLTQGLPTLDGWFTRFLPALVAAVVLPPVVLLLLVRADPGSAVVVALTLPLVPVFAVLLGRATEARARRQWRATADLASHFLDVVRGLPTLRVHRRAARQVPVVAAATEEQRRRTLDVLRVAFLSGTALDLVATLSVGLVAVTAGMRVAAGELALPTALLAILLAPEAYRPLREVGARFHDTAAAGAVVEEVTALLARPVATPRGGCAPGLWLSGVRCTDDRGRDLVGAASVPGLAGASGAELRVHPGELVALAGPSGAGKTTLARVVAGTRAPDAGEVLHPLDPPPATLAQRPALPHAGSVREAVLAGRDASGSALLAALRGAGVDLPPDTPLGEAGVGLSAGQRQRVALARTLLGVELGARTLVLDEPTAHLDARAEAHVVATLRRLALDGVAVLVVAHRPALLAAADRVVRVVRVPRPPAEGGGVPTGAPAPPPTQEADPGPAPTPSAGRPVRPGRVRLRRVDGALAVAAGTGSALSGVVLTAAATWLLVTAADRPPVLTLSVAAVVVRATAVLRPLLAYGERLLSHDVAFRRLARWRARVLADLVPRVPGPLTGTRRRGELLQRVADDVDARLDGLLRGRHPVAVTASSSAVLLAATALLVGTTVALAAVPGLLLAGSLAPAVAARAQRWEQLRVDGLRDRGVRSLDVLGAVEDLRTLPVDPLAALDRGSAALHRIELRQARTLAAAQALALTGAGVAVLGAVLAAVAAGRPPVVVAVLALAGTVALEPLRALPEAVRTARRAAAATRRLETLATTPVPARDPAAPGVLPAPAPTTAPEGRGRRGLRFLGVEAGWDPDRPCLRGLDLDLAPGTVTVLRGPSGSGKSTVAALALRFLDVRAGRVLLDGEDTAGLAGDAVRGVVGLVGDDEHVFATSLRENLALAAPGCTDEALRSVLHRVRLDDWFVALPAGLDTRLGDGGAVLSGGERRRLALARALLADVDVLVLDEPTEGLDERTAADLLDDLVTAARAEGRGVLLLAHREEGLADADRVLELSAGRIPHPLHPLHPLHSPPDDRGIPLPAS
ncbi:thiol reductant ABC exporter subunit CydC [Kineococcus gynurae]|uniref:Thiol reductant ABC exporter subunit CydC n=1 Tax=Kineococcus gynurae TaxID=452979 RepID=A0ABV5LR55_9ACTN